MDFIIFKGRTYIATRTNRATLIVYSINERSYIHLLLGRLLHACGSFFDFGLYVRRCWLLLWLPLPLVHSLHLSSAAHSPPTRPPINSRPGPPHFHCPPTIHSRRERLPALWVATLFMLAHSYDGLAPSSLIPKLLSPLMRKAYITHPMRSDVG